MTTKKFKEYLSANFALDGATWRFIDNILMEARLMPEFRREAFVCRMFSQTIGITNEEIKEHLFANAEAERMTALRAQFA